MLENPPDLIMNINGVTISGLKPIWRTAVVSGGNAVFNVTEDNTLTGVALYNSIRMPIFSGIEPDYAYAFGLPVLSADKKTVTVPVKKTGAAVTILGISVIGSLVPANGATVYAFIVGD